MHQSPYMNHKHYSIHPVTYLPKISQTFSKTGGSDGPILRQLINVNGDYLRVVGGGPCTRTTMWSVFPTYKWDKVLGRSCTHGTPTTPRRSGNALKHTLTTTISQTQHTTR